ESSLVRFEFSLKSSSCSTSAAAFDFLLVLGGLALRSTTGNKPSASSRTWRAYTAVANSKLSCPAKRKLSASKAAVELPSELNREIAAATTQNRNTSTV